MFTPDHGPVCVTGANGFIGAHIVTALLDEGYTVRATVRDPANPEKTEHLLAAAEGRSGTLELHQGDLLEPGSFDVAIEGCFGVIHAAAVARLTAKDPQRDIVDPSVEGVNNVLSSVRKSESVKRFIQTSSVAAIYPHAIDGTTFTEADWNETATLKNDPYSLAKATAERSVWQFAEALDREGFGVVSINPALVLGPPLHASHKRSSVSVLRELLINAFPLVPKLGFWAVDVRDVSWAHLEALRNPAIEGRFIVAREGRWMRAFAQDIARLFPDYKINTLPMPNPLMYIAAIFDSRLSLSSLRLMLGRMAAFDNRRSQQVLGVKYRPMDETVRDTVNSLVENGWAKPKRR